MIVEFLGMKNGKITRRFKELCIKFDYDLHGFLVGDKYFEYDKFHGMFDRIKILVDNEEWINKSLISIDFSSFEIGKEYDFSDDMCTWKNNILLATDKDSEFAFKVGVKDSGIYSWWRYAREII